MLTTTDIEWHRCSRLPVFVRFHYIPPTGEHPLTLPDVRERYSREIHDSALVIWRAVGSERFGFRAGIDEFASRMGDFGGFELGYTRPAKGSGSIWLRKGSETVFSTDRFSDDLLGWFRQITTVLSQIFPDAVIEKDYGYDA
jgi:hypothetical protein